LKEEKSPFLQIDGFLDQFVSLVKTALQNPDVECVMRYTIIKEQNKKQKILDGIAFVFPEEEIYGKDEKNIKQKRMCRLVRWLTVKNFDTGVGTEILNSLIIHYSVGKGVSLYGFVHNSQISVTKFYEKHENITKVTEEKDFPSKISIKEIFPQITTDVEKNVEKGWICYWYPSKLLGIKEFDFGVIAISGLSNEKNEKEIFTKDCRSITHLFEKNNNVYTCEITMESIKQEGLSKYISDIIKTYKIKKIIIWYSGHGSNLDNEEFPSILIDNDLKPIITIVDELKNYNKNTDMIFATDCCNVKIKGSKEDVIKPAKIPSEEERYDPWNFIGTMIISSCAPGEYSFYNITGSYFTNYFSKKFNGIWNITCQSAKDHFKEKKFNYIDENGKECLQFGMQVRFKQIDFVQDKVKV